MNKSVPIDGPDSLDCQNIIFDGPVDDEIRPCRPSLIPMMKAQAEKQKRLEAMMKELKDKENKPSQQDS